MRGDRLHLAAPGLGPAGLELGDGDDVGLAAEPPERHQAAGVEDQIGVRGVLQRAARVGEIGALGDPVPQGLARLLLGEEGLGADPAVAVGGARRPRNGRRGASRRRRTSGGAPSERSAGSGCCARRRRRDPRGSRRARRARGPRSRWRPARSCLRGTVAERVLGRHAEDLPVAAAARDARRHLAASGVYAQRAPRGSPSRAKCLSRSGDRRGTRASGRPPCRRGCAPPRRPSCWPRPAASCLRASSCRRA